MKNYLKVVLLLLCIPFISNDADAQIFGKKKKKEATKPAAPAKKGTASLLLVSQRNYEVWFNNKCY